jgi:hypothetical protein
VQLDLVGDLSAAALAVLWHTLRAIDRIWPLTCRCSRNCSKGPDGIGHDLTRTGFLEPLCNAPRAAKASAVTTIVIDPPTRFRRAQLVQATGRVPDLGHVLNFVAGKIYGFFCRLEVVRFRLYARSS